METDQKGKKPFANTALARFLDRRIEELKGVKTQREIAYEVGYKTPNLISMFRHGESKVPLDKIASLARSLDVDAGHLLRLGLEQYWPGLNDAIKEILGRIATTNEEDLFLKKWRLMTDNSDPTPTSQMKERVGRIIEQIGGEARRNQSSWRG
jgi:hypothetical protein